MIRSSRGSSQVAYFLGSVDFDALELLDTRTILEIHIFLKLLREHSCHEKSFSFIFHTSGPDSEKSKMSLKLQIRGHHRLTRQCFRNTK